MFVMIFLLVIMSTQAFAQIRRSQLELFAGGAIPLGPEVFKDYYKTGFSLHGQYVLFLSPNIGVTLGGAYELFTFDGDTYVDDFIDEWEDYYWYNYGMDLDDYDIKADGNFNVIELGVGLRPYLTPATASSQIFIFGMGTYNMLSGETTVSVDNEESTVKADENKMGLAAGAGLELPAGNNNIIFQGLMRFIFTEDETTSFIGITAGIVF